MEKKKLKLGDVYCIPLPNGKIAFARLFKEYTLAVYKKMYSDISDLPVSEDYVFIVGVYKDLLQDGKWKIVGNRPFISDYESWPPPQCIKDKINGSYSLYYKGDIKPSTEAECAGLEHVAAWDRHHIIDRIMVTQNGI